MSGGLEWQGGMLEQPTLQEWWNSPDWVQYVLDKPMSDPSGTRFVYNSGCSHLLSAVLQRATGMKAEAFAAPSLFTPLGIEDWYWQTDPQGMSTGGWGLWLRPRDMAKLARLFMNGGRWNDRQVVPAKWVSESTRMQIEAGAPWLSDGYGYQWWVDRQGYFMALGFGGQFIVAVPDRNLIMVTASSLPPRDFFAPETLLNDFILPGSHASSPLPRNLDATEALNDCIAKMAGQQETPVPPLPSTALKISGKTYHRCDEADARAPGGPGWMTASLVFAPGKDSALFVEDGESIEIGLDGKYRACKPVLERASLPLPRSAVDLGRGRWNDDGDFVIEHFPLGDAGRFVDTFHFEGDSLMWRQDAPTYGFSRMIKGRLKP